jgi:PhnB protein
MSTSVQARPAQYPAVTPYLIVRDAAAAISFYQRVLGAVLRMKLDAPNGKIGHAELAIDGSVIMLADESPAHNAFAPAPGQRSTVGLHLYVTDSDAVVRAAEAAGATVTSPVETKFYGDRMGTVTDPFGHIWHISTHVEDVSPEEMARRAAAMIGGCASKPVGLRQHPSDPFMVPARNIYSWPSARICVHPR